MHNLLPDGGRLIIAVPNAEGRLYRLGLALQRAFNYSGLMRELYYFHNPNMHYFYYTPRSLKFILRRHGFVPEAIYTMDAFDWKTIHKRVENGVARGALKVGGRAVATSGFTRKENLILVARK
jgi:hypothetical protein